MEQVSSADRPVGVGHGGSSAHADESTNASSQPGSYNPYRADNPTNSLLGAGKQSLFSRRMKRKIDYEYHEIIFLVLAVIAMCVAVGFSVYRMDEEYSKPSAKDKASFTFAVLIVFNAAFLLVYAVHGVMFEHFEEMVAFSVASCVVFIYVAVDFAQHRSDHDDVKLARFILVMIGFPVLAVFSIYCAKQFRWLKFRVAGATEEKQRMYTTFCRMESLLLFDFQVAVSLFILILYRGSSLTTIETIILSLGLVYCLCWSALGFYAARKENKPLVYLFEALSVALPAYIAYKSVRIVQRWDEYKRDEIELLAIMFYVAAGIGLIVRGLLLFVVEQARRGFGHGLWNQVS